MTISGAEPSTFQVSPSFSPDKIDLWKDFPVVQDAWIGTHQALRFELSELDLALELVASRPLTKQDIDNIQEAFEAHIEHSLAHQEQEDKIMIPELKKRCSNNPPNHGGIENELNSKLKSLVKELKVGGDVQELRSELKTYMSIILPHMDEEEAELIPLMRAFFTPKEMSVISREFFTTGPKVSDDCFHQSGTSRLCRRRDWRVSANRCLFTFFTFLSFFFTILDNDGFFYQQHGTSRSTDDKCDNDFHPPANQLRVSQIIGGR
jgi:hemerythrin-like domain-containing protein